MILEMLEIRSSAQNTSTVIDIESHLKFDVGAFDQNYKIRS